MELGYYVYHIGSTGMSLDEGYVGITNNPQRRWQQHCRANTYVGNAIRKYGVDNIRMVIIKYTTEQRALEIEESLRPDKCIGWNIAKGGSASYNYTGLSVSKSNSTREITDEYRDNMSKAQRGVNNPMAKPVNIYDYKTDKLIAENVSIREWSRINKTCRKKVTLTATGKKTNHKGIYARYIGE